MSVTDDGQKLPLLNYFPISPSRVIIVAINDIDVVPQHVRQINNVLFRKPAYSIDGKSVKFNVKKIYENDVKFINSLSWKYIKDGIVFVDENRIHIPK